MLIFMYRQTYAHLKGECRYNQQVQDHLFYDNKRRVYFLLNHKTVSKIMEIVSERVNLFPNKPWFLRVYSTVQVF